MHIYGADTVHETETLPHVFEGLGAGPCKQNGIVMELERYLRYVSILHITLDLACSIAAGDKDIVADLYVSLAHKRLDTIVTAIDKDAVGYANIALHIHMKAIFVAVRKTDLGATWLCIRLYEATGKYPVVWRAGNLVVHVGRAVQVVLSKVEYKAVDNHRPDGAGVAVRPPCVNIHQRRSELLVCGLELCDILDDVTLAEIGRIAPVYAYELAKVVGGIAKLTVLDISAVQVAKVIAFGNKNLVVVLCSIDSFLQIFHRSSGRKTVGTRTSGGCTHIIGLALCRGCGSNRPRAHISCRLCGIPFHIVHLILYRLLGCVAESS